MKIKKILMISMLVMSLFPPSIAHAKTNEFPKTMYITSENGLNVRKGGSVECEKVGALPYRTEVNVKYISKDNWAIIDYDGVSQFVCAEWLSEEQPAELSIKRVSKNNSFSSEKTARDSVVGGTYYGNCRITHYCSCSICCGKWAAYAGTTASGAPAIAGTTVAMDLPFGTQVSINGHVYTVQDRGVSGNAVDIYCSSHAEAVSGGMYYADVYIVG